MQFLQSMIDGHRAVINGIKLLWRCQSLCIYTLVGGIFILGREYFASTGVVGNSMVIVMQLCAYILLTIISTFVVAAFCKKSFACLAGTPITILQSFLFEKRVYRRLVFWGLCASLFHLPSFNHHASTIMKVLSFVAALFLFSFVVMVLINENLTLRAAIKRSVCLGGRFFIALFVVFAEILLYCSISIMLLRLILFLTGYFSKVAEVVVLVNNIGVRFVMVVFVSSLIWSATLMLYQVIVRRERF